MNVTKVLIRFTTHNSLVTVDDLGHITVFKYNTASCDFDIFDAADFAASDYILEPLPLVYYSVHCSDE